MHNSYFFMSSFLKQVKGDEADKLPAALMDEHVREERRKRRERGKVGEIDRRTDRTEREEQRKKKSITILSGLWQE